ncbi:MAG: ABC transporter permease [Acidimicrobiia bacterium]|nr:ABC transporter permease [Acidimicrobiia bacterium]
MKARVFYRTLLGFGIAYLFLPVFVVVAFSFNDLQGRRNVSWEGFTLRHWAEPFKITGLSDAVLNSLTIAFLSALISTILGTLIALALVRYRFRGRSATNLMLFLPMASPEVVTGSALLTLFIVAQVGRGYMTVLLAHILFNLSYTVVTVRARIVGFDRHLEEAAMDLYANEWQTFRRVTLPMIMPGVLAAFMLAFALSFDDFVITNFNSGSLQTFPIFVYGATKRGVPPQVNVLGTMIFVAMVVATTVFLVVQGRRKKAEP